MRTKVLKFLTRVRPNIRCRAVTLLLLVLYHQDIRIWWWHDTMTWWHDDVGIHLVGVGSCLHEWQTSILNQKPSPTTIISEIFSHFHTLGVNLPLSVFFLQVLSLWSKKFFCLITLMKCLKGHKSLQTLCDGSEAPTQWNSVSVRDKNDERRTDWLTRETARDAYASKKLFQLMYNHKPKSNVHLRKSTKHLTEGQLYRKISFFFDTFPKPSGKKVNIFWRPKITRFKLPYLV